MVVGDIVASLILGDEAGQMLWVRHPIQFVGAGALLLALVLSRPVERGPSRHAGRRGPRRRGRPAG
jgi:hypothetical protein